MKEKMKFLAICLTAGMLGTSALATSQQLDPQQAQAQPVGLLDCAKQPPAELEDKPGLKSLAVNDSSFQPGANDPFAIPAGRYRMFASQGIAAFLSADGGLEASLYATDTQTTPQLGQPRGIFTDAWDYDGFGAKEFFAAAGRIVSPSKDNFVWVRRAEGGNPNTNGSKVNVFFPSTPSQTLSATLSTTLLARQPNSSDFIAVAEADLDRVVGADLNYHDEVVVAHAVEKDPQTDNYRISLDVLNYGSAQATNPEVSHFEVYSVIPQFNANPSADSSGTLPNDNILAVATGDFDGDGRPEIALATMRPEHFHLQIFRYITTGGVHDLQFVRDFDWKYVDLPAYIKSMSDVGSISLAAGDFDGDGKDELAVGLAQWGSKTINNAKYSSYAVDVEMIKFDSDLNPTIKKGGISQEIGGEPDNLFAVERRPRIQLAAGQFYFNPPGVPWGQNQLLVAWNDTGVAPGPSAIPKPKIRLVPIPYLRDLTPENQDRYYDIQNSTNPVNKVYSIAVGGFQGTHAPDGKPVASVAVNYWGGSTVATAKFSYMAVGYLTFNVDGSLSNPVWATSVLDAGVDLRARMPVVAFDQAGRSMILGAPLHTTVYGVPTLEYVLQEPPKHAYWDEKTKQVVNFTRYDGNNVHLSKSDTASFLTEDTSETSSSIGGASAIDAATSVQAGGNLGLAKSTVTNSHELMAQFTYDENATKSHYESSYGAQTFSTTGQTDRDDYLIGKQQNFDIWRYRVFNSNFTGTENNFYQFVLPGQSYAFHGGGLNFDWYQPIQENGNILSYPEQLGSKGDPYLPDDLKPITLSDGKILSVPIIPASRNYFDGNSGSESLDYSTETQQGDSWSTQKSWSEAFDYKFSIEGSASVLKSNNATVSVCGSFEEHNGDSWSSSGNSVTTFKTETSVTLNKSAGLLNTTYPFYPVVYSTSNGSIRMAFAVPNPASPESNPAGFEKYAQLYGAHPDPALGLPYRLVPKPQGSGFLETWIPNLDNDRMKMRGILFRHADIDKENGEYDLYGFNPNAGDVVRIEPRVYNFSTSQVAYNTVVSFQVIPYDETMDNEVCSEPINAAAGSVSGLLCPRSARKVVGTAIVPRLNPLQFTCISGMDSESITGCATPVYLNWNTTGYGPVSGTAGYRVYVVLNPDNQGGTETYPIEPEPIHITSVSNTTPMVVTAPGYTFKKGDYVIIGGVQGLDAANGTFTVTPVSATEFALDGTTVGTDTYTGGGMATLLDPGQNNQGYAQIGISAPPELTATEANTSPEDYLNEDSLVASPTTGVGSLAHEATTAYLNVPLKLRFTAFSNMVHTEPAHMMLYEGDPSEPGSFAVADRTVHPGENGEKGSSVWFKWTPETLGAHNLYAVLLEAGTPQVAAQMTVNVVAAPQPAAEATNRNSLQPRRPD